MSRHALTDTSKGINLADFSTDTPAKTDKEAIQARSAELLLELEALQDKLFASKKGAILLVLQGMDTAGKDGTIRRVFGVLTPLGVSLHAFKQPTAQELAHDFLWRAHMRTPERGFVGIFNRSYYEAVISDYVQGMIEALERDRRCQHIRDFEDMLRENGTRVVKCFLHISKSEQKDRLVKRLEDPTKYWKISKADISSRADWDKYQLAYADAIARTSTSTSPWHIIPADKKWYRDYAVTEIIVEALREIAPEYPPLLEKIKAADIPD